MAIEVCPDCWHEDCTCGETFADRQARLNREAVARIAQQRTTAGH